MLPARVPQGVALQKLLDSLKRDKGTKPLSKAQREVMEINGMIRWAVRKMIRLTRHAQKISMVATRPEVPDAMDASLGVVANMWYHREEGLSYCTDAPAKLAISGFLKGTRNDLAGTSITEIDAAGMANGPPLALHSVTDSSWNLMTPDLTAMQSLHTGCECFQARHSTPRRTPATRRPRDSV